VRSAEDKLMYCALKISRIGVLFKNKYMMYSIGAPMTAHRKNTCILSTKAAWELIS
jgi:hypothetical protein